MRQVLARVVSAQGHAALLPPLQEHHVERPEIEGVGVSDLLIVISGFGFAFVMLCLIAVSTSRDERSIADERTRKHILRAVKGNPGMTEDEIGRYVRDHYDVPEIGDLVPELVADGLLRFEPTLTDPDLRKQIAQYHHLDATPTMLAAMRTGGYRLRE